MDYEGGVHKVKEDYPEQNRWLGKQVYLLYAVDHY
jgi:hypothetical protein